MKLNIFLAHSNEAYFKGNVQISTLTTNEYISQIAALAERKIKTATPTVWPEVSLCKFWGENINLCGRYWRKDLYYV